MQEETSAHKSFRMALAPSVIALVALYAVAPTETCTHGFNLSSASCVAESMGKTFVTIATENYRKLGIPVPGR